MKRIAHFRPSGSMVVAIVAIVMSTAGSAAAAGLITGSEIKNGTITSKNIRGHSLLAKDFKPGQLPTGTRGLTGATGPSGPAGPAGPSGPAGAAGRDGFGLLAYPHDDDVLAHGSSTDLAADCPPGTFVTGGDAGAFDALTGAQVGNQVVQNQAMAGPDGYTAHFENELASGNAAQIFVDAACADANEVDPKATPASRFRRAREPVPEVEPR